MRGLAHRSRLLTGGLLLGAAGAALAPAGPTALDPLKIAVASAASLGNSVYVAVVVDFGGGSNMSTISKCVPVASTSRDSDALAAAVGTNNVSYNDSGLLCAIDNYPANGVQNCGQAVGNGTYDYWSYWHGASGTWVYASDGPTEQPVDSPADDVVGLRYQTNGSDNPGNPPPSPSVAPSYAQICNASTEVTPSQTSTSDTTTTTTTTTSPSVTPTTVSTTPRSGGASGVTATGTGSKTSSASSAIGTTTTTTTTTQPTTSSRDTGTGKGGASASSCQSDASATLHKSSGGSGSQVLPVVLVAAVVAGLGALALIRWRRKPADG